VSVEAYTLTMRLSAVDLVPLWGNKPCRARHMRSKAHAPTASDTAHIIGTGSTMVEKMDKRRGDWSTEAQHGKKTIGVDVHGEKSLPCMDQRHCQAAKALLSLVVRGVKKCTTGW